MATRKKGEKAFDVPEGEFVAVNTETGEEVRLKVDEDDGPPKLSPADMARLEASAHELGRLARATSPSWMNDRQKLTWTMTVMLSAVSGHISEVVWGRIERAVKAEPEISDDDKGRIYVTSMMGAVQVLTDMIGRRFEEIRSRKEGVLN